MDYWAKAPLRRDQILLFCPTLDDSISQDHPVRQLEYVCGHNLDFQWLAEGRTSTTARWAR